MSLTKKQYLRVHGEKCPHCESFNLEAGHTAFDGFILTQAIYCNDCHAEWDDEYETKLKGYDNLEVKE